MTIDTLTFQTRITKKSWSPHHGPQWRRGYRALKTLLDDSQRTEMAFEIFDALDPNMRERGLRRILRYAQGRRLFYEQPSLLEALRDKERLKALPAGSFGHAYLQHMEKHGLDVDKLIVLRRDTEEFQSSHEPGLEWFGERQSLSHDLWHVLTGYGADDLGEATLLAFALAQHGGLANWLLTIGAGIRTVQTRGLSYAAELWRAWRRGRRAVPLDAVPYEQLLGEPLSSVRAALKIGEPERLHRDPAIYASNFA